MANGLFKFHLGLLVLVYTSIGVAQFDTDPINGTSSKSKMTLEKLIESANVSLAAPFLLSSDGKVVPSLRKMREESKKSSLFPEGLKSGSQSSKSGTNHGGGGDPLANDAVLVGEQILKKLQTRAGKLLELPIELIRYRLTEVDASLEGQDPLLILPEGETVECFGVAKLGCFRDGRIEIARGGWLKASGADKVQVVTMEILMSLDVAGRYFAAREVVLLFSYEELQRVAVLSQLEVWQGKSDFDGSFSFEKIPLGSLFQFQKNYNLAAASDMVLLESLPNSPDVRCELTYNMALHPRTILRGTIFRLDRKRSRGADMISFSSIYELKSTATGSILKLSCTLGIAQTDNKVTSEILERNGIFIRVPTTQRF